MVTARSNKPMTNAERQDRLRKAHDAAGRKEVRGIYATPENAAKIKRYAARLKRRITPELRPRCVSSVEPLATCYAQETLT